MKKLVITALFLGLLATTGIGCNPAGTTSGRSAGGVTMEASGHRMSSGHTEQQSTKP